MRSTSMSRRRSVVAGLLIVTGLTTVSLVAAPESAFAAGATYYVDSASGSCSNAGAGTSATAPWCDFTPVDAHTFQPGDALLLARGAQWSQELTLTGNGTSSSPITVAAYGAGARPKIVRSGSAGDVAVKLTNPNYWSVSNLDVSDAGAGVLVKITTKGNQGLALNDLYIHGITGVTSGTAYAAPSYRTTMDSAATTAAQANAVWMSAGIDITSANVSFDPATEWLLKGISISNVEGTHNISSFHTEVAYNTTAVPAGTAVRNAYQNATFSHLYFHDDDGPGVGCRDGFALSAVSNSTVMDSVLDDEGDCNTPSGTAAMYIGDTNHLNFVNNVIRDTPNSGSPDQTGFDFEGFTESVQVKGNYFGNNAGPGLEFLAIHGATDFGTNHTLSDNVFAGNPVSIHRFGTDYVYTGIIQNNLSSDAVSENGNGPYSGSLFAGFTQSNNVRVSAPTHAAADFSGTQGANGWSYQRSTNGSDWSNLPYYDSTLDIWRPSSTVTTPLVGQFDLHPGAGSNTVARAWTAPRDGVVSIRGTALKADLGGGDGVDIRITRNGTKIWPTSSAWQHVNATESTGIATDLDKIAVTTGDVIRFEVSAGANTNYDTTSWAPSVGYYRPLATYEAEDATLSGGASVNSNHTGYTDTGFVDSFTAVGSKISFAVDSAVAGASYVRVRYANALGYPRYMSLYVNGTKTQVEFPDVQNGDWNKWGVADFPVTLMSGANTISIQYDSGDSGNLNVDSIGVAAARDLEVHEAEKFSLTGLAVATNHPGYTGTGFLDSWTAPSRGAAFGVAVPSAGSYNLVLKYANATGVNRTLSLYANGTKQRQLVFPSSVYGSWSTWQTLTTPVTLSAGANTVRLQWDAGDNGNINLDNVGVELVPAL